VRNLITIQILEQMLKFSISFCSYNNQRNQHFDPYGNPIKQEPNSELNGSNGSNNGNPLAHLNESVNSLDPLNAMEKSLNDQVR
jgi:hypothetical protein